MDSPFLMIIFSILSRVTLSMKNMHKIVASFVGVALLITLGIAVTGFSFRAFKQIEKASAARKHAFRVLGRAENLLSNLVDAETGLRGFLLTQDETFLEPCLKVQNTMIADLKALRELTQLPSAYRYLDALTALIRDKREEWHNVVELIRNQDRKAALANICGNKGRRLMDSIREEIKSLRQIQQDALALNDKEFQTNMRSLFILIVSVSLIMLLFALLFAWLLYREIQQRVKNLVFLETQNLLRIQEDANNRLQQVNASLQISEEKLAVTLHCIGDGVMATDVHGNVTLLNPIAEHLTGWSKAEAEGRSAEEIFHILNEETREPAPLPIKETLLHGTLQGLANHTLLIARDGSEYSIADSCAPIRTSDGLVVGAVLIFRDVTKQREIEIGMEKLRKELEVKQKNAEEASELAESVINTVREPLLSLDQDLRVVAVSRSFYEFFKVKPEETVGHLIYDLGNKQWDIPRLRELLETILPQKTSFDNYEVEHDFSTIGRRVMHLNARQIQRTSGKERIILLAIEDITERKKISDLIKRDSDELEKIVRERTQDLIDLQLSLERSKHLADIGTLAATVAHELRNTLAAVSVAAYNIRKKVKDPLLERSLNTIENKIAESEQIINNVLSYAKIKISHFEPVMINDVLKACIEELKSQIADHNFSLSDDIASTEGLLIQADPLQIKEIFTNIINNSRDAVSGIPGIIKIVSARKGPVVDIFIQDNGEGIEKEDIEKVTTPFFTTKAKGTGLGLAVCNQILMLHDGSLAIKSIKGAGTSIRVTLPIQRRKSETNPACG